MTFSPLDFSLMALFTADHAEVVNGKLYVSGGCFSRLIFPSYPQVVPHMAVVAVILVPFGKYNADHRFLVTMDDSDQQTKLLTIEGAFRVGSAPDMEYGDPTVMPLAVPINNLALERAGDYTFAISVDDGPVLGRYSIRATDSAS